MSLRNGPCKSGDVREETDEETHTRVVIDSRDRNTLFYPRPNRYEIPLAYDVRDVHQVKLILAVIPFTAYLIPENKRSIPYAVYDSDKDEWKRRRAELEVGNYSSEELATEIERAMNADFEKEEEGETDFFEVLYSSRQDKYEFRAKREFRLDWKGPEVPHGENGQLTRAYAPGSVGRILGFDRVDAESRDDGEGSNRSHYVRAPFRKNFDHPKYVVMRLDGAEANVSPNPVLDRSFALLVENRAKDYDNTAMHTYDPPVSRFNRVRVAFFDHDGELYDFQNHDHRLELLLVSRKQKRLCAA